ncbi:MAG TPA: UDP-N-acetylmuramoyl-tripeptide--D-alanyl-D-alanine ligase [Steroidobacteraceae bacterium]
MSLNLLLDRVEHSGKAAAKMIYRGPTIAAARPWRSVLRGTRFIGVTGSAGKTTTKDLLYCALAGRFRCVRSADSNNQLYSIARTLIGTGPRTDYCVQEVGASERGAFDPMMSLLRPHVGIVTNIGTDHFKSFRTREGVAAEKSKLIACLPADGLAVLNADDDLVAAMASQCRARVVTFGMRGGAEFRGEIEQDRWPDRLALRIHRGGAAVLVQTQLLGAHQAGNVLAAVATACELGMPLADAAIAVSRHEPLLGRMSVQLSARGITFVRDDWKAPLWSLPAMFEFMSNAIASRRLIVLGTISDYGGDSSRVYRQCVSRALEAAEFVLLVGVRAKSLQAHFSATAGARLQGFEHAKDAARWLTDFTRAGDLVLLKGSNQSDHLARLALANDLEVGCWRSNCRRGIFCDHCRLLRAEAAP